MIRRLEADGTGARIVDGPAKRKRTGRKPDADRLAAEPWRAGGYGSTYRRNRQVVIGRQKGRCAVTGKQVAEKRGGTWRITEPGAGVHHKVALSDGGSDDPSNLVLLSASAHALIDAERRRHRG